MCDICKVSNISSDHLHLAPNNMIDCDNVGNSDFLIP